MTLYEKYFRDKEKEFKKKLKKIIFLKAKNYFLQQKNLP